MSSASKFPGTGQSVAGTPSNTSTITEPALSTSSTDRNRTGARAGTTNRDRDAPLPEIPGQGAAEMSNGSADKAAQGTPFKMGSRYTIRIGKQSGNVNVGSRQRNGGGVYNIDTAKKESSKNNETSNQKGAEAGDTPDETERQESSSEDQPTINLGELQGNFNFGDDQVNEGGQYEI